jgi:hypothetical protein
MSIEKASLYSMEVYKKDGITYLPHYRNWAIFVGPGYPHASNKRYTAEELTAAGATKEISMLWSRGQHGEVTDTRL